MKIIHCADIHLGSKIDTKFSKEISEERKMSIRKSFERMVEYAKNNNISIILLSGDVFDLDNPFKKDKDFFYGIIKSNPKIDFLYLRGNHDKDRVTDEELENLKTFSDQWTSYDYGFIRITGIEETASNSISLYSTLSLPRDKINIVMMHGQIGSDMGQDKINLMRLRDKNIDYLALGHIHSYGGAKLDDRGIYAYCGCLEGRGFDEIGEKGFICLDISDRISVNFIPNSNRRIIEKRVDVSNMQNPYEMSKKILTEGQINRQDIYRIYLMGEVDIDTYALADTIKEHLSSYTYFVDVKDNTKKKFDIHSYDGDLSLKGEFVRKVYENNQYTEEEKLQIITYGLHALNREEIE